DDGTATLERVLLRRLPRLSDLTSSWAVALIAASNDLSKDAFSTICKRLLTDRGRLELCEYLVSRGNLPLANDVAQGIDDKRMREGAFWIAGGPPPSGYASLP